MAAGACSSRLPSAGVAVKQGGLAGVVEPEDDAAVPFLGVEPDDGEFFVVRLVVDEAGHFEVVAAVDFFGGVPFAVAGGGVGAADEDFDGGADELAKFFGRFGGCADLFVGIIGEPAEELALEVGARGCGGRMIFVPHG